MPEQLNNLYIGVMSGTSLDGVDVAICNFAEKWQIIAQESFDFPEKLRSDILDIANNKAMPISKIAQIDQELGEIYAQSINKTITKADISATNIHAIGYTVRRCITKSRQILAVQCNLAIPISLPCKLKSPS